MPTAGHDCRGGAWRPGLYRVQPVPPPAPEPCLGPVLAAVVWELWRDLCTSLNMEQVQSQLGCDHDADPGRGEGKLTPGLRHS